MYRKEHCPSLLGDGKQDDSENTLLNDGEGKPKLNWHKVILNFLFLLLADTDSTKSSHISFLKGLCVV
jgi:hypothetical protein